MYQSVKTLQCSPLHSPKKKVEAVDLIGIGLLLWGLLYIVQGLCYLISKIIFN